MKRITFFLLAIMVSFALNSCWTTEHIPLQDEYNQRWRNMSKNDIIRQVGIPNQTVSLDDGESVLVYEAYSSVTNTENSSSSYAYIPNKTGIFGRGIYANSGSSGVSVTTENRSYAEFFIDKDGKCYLVRTNHTKAIKKNRPGRTAILVGGITLGVTLWLNMVINSK